MSLEITIQAIVFKTIVYVSPNTILAVQKTTLSTASYPYGDNAVAECFTRQ